MAIPLPVRRARRAGTEPVDDRQVEMVALAARGLSLAEPRWRYTCLSLCVLDAVFSPAASYPVVRRLVDRYAEWACIARPRLTGSEEGSQQEQGVAVLTRQIRDAGVEQFAADVLGNSQRTYRSLQAPLKARAALEFAERLVDAGAHTRAHLARLRRDEAALARLDESLAEVPGHGSGQRLDYFHLLAGDEQRVVCNRYLLAWLARVTKADVTPALARALVRRAAAEVGVTPAALGDAVWRARGEAADSAAPTTT